MKICLFVNGPSQSIPGIRAKGLTKHLDGKRHAVEIMYRDGRRLTSLIRFFNHARKGRPDVIYAVDMGYSGAIAGCLAKLFYGAKFVVDTGDLIYELFKASGEAGFIKCRIAKIVESTALKTADSIVVRGSFHKEHLESQGFENIFHIPDGVDVDIHSPKSANIGAMRQRLGINGDFTIGVLGSLCWNKRFNMCYGWDLMNALQFLRDLPVKGVIIGDGNGLPKLKKMAQELEVSDRVIFTGWLSYSEISHYLPLLDICLSTQTDNLVGQVRTTAKLPVYLSFGKYVIATNVGDAKQILPGVGMLLPYRGIKDENYPRLLAEKIRWLFENRDELEKAEKGIRIAEERFEYKVLAKRLDEILNRFSGDVYRGVV